MADEQLMSTPAGPDAFSSPDQGGQSVPVESAEQLTSVVQQAGLDPRSSLVASGMAAQQQVEQISTQGADPNINRPGPTYGDLPADAFAQPAGSSMVRKGTVTRSTQGMDKASRQALMARADAPLESAEAVSKATGAMEQAVQQYIETGRKVQDKSDTVVAESDEQLAQLGKTYDEKFSAKKRAIEADLAEAEIKLDPDRYFSNMETQKKVALGIGMVLESLQSGLNRFRGGKGVPQTIANYLEKMAMADLDAQRADKQAALRRAQLGQQSLESLRDDYLDERTLELKNRAQRLAQVRLLLADATQGIQNAQVQSQAAEAAAALELKEQQLDQQAIEAAAMHSARQSTTQFASGGGAGGKGVPDVGLTDSERKIYQEQVQGGREMSDSAKGAIDAIRKLGKVPGFSEKLKGYLETSDNSLGTAVRLLASDNEFQEAVARVAGPDLRNFSALLGRLSDADLRIGDVRMGVTNALREGNYSKAINMLGRVAKDGLRMRVDGLQAIAQGRSDPRERALLLRNIEQVENDPFIKNLARKMEKDGGVELGEDLGMDDIQDMPSRESEPPSLSRGEGDAFSSSYSKRGF